MSTTGSEPLVEESADTGLAAYGDPLADGATEGPDSLVDPMRGRIHLTISTTSSLKPGTDVELTVGGVAREPIDGGEVVLTLPTRALMDHAGKGSPELPAVARWVLPAMAKGDNWSGSHTVPGEAAGWYRVMANAYTDGPDGGPWLFDGVLGEAWMHVSETDGRLDTHPLGDSAAPMAGPAAGWPAGPQARSPNYPFLHPDSVYLHVVYSVSEWEGFKPAVRARIWASLKKEDRGWEDLGRVTVPGDGIVAFKCPKNYGEYLAGGGDAPDTYRVQGRKDIANWGANKSSCGKLVQLEVLAHRYLPWRLLNLAADTLTQHFGHSRGRVSWQLHFERGRNASYNRWTDKITLAWLAAEHPRFRWVAAHEYAHALHEKALGGLFGKFRTPGCSDHEITLPSSYERALSEGFADYAGTVGSVTDDYPDGYYGECFEYFGTPDAPWNWCRNVTHERKPEIEGWVAALFMDLIDDNYNYEGFYDDAFDDKTHYGGYYVAGVFKSCEARRGNFLDPWKKRSKVYDYVWCLEEYVHKPTHERVFPDTPVPDTAKHKRPPEQPSDWNALHIRQTWLRNLAEEGR